MFGSLVLALMLALPVRSAQSPAPAPAPGPGPARPAWIDTLPEAPGRLYALGTAELEGSESAALALASDRARLAVAGRLRATVRGQTTVTTRSSESQREGAQPSGAGDRQVRDVVSVGIKAEDLPGLVVERTHCDPLARTAYALAYIDLALARTTLAARLDQARDHRLRIGDEQSRRARWRLRRLQADLEDLDDAIALFAPTGAGQDLRPALLAEQAAVGKRLALLEGMALPPLDLARTTMGLRSNVDLPLGIEAYLEAQIHECGLRQRNLDPDFILELSFSGGGGGPEFLYADMNIFDGVTYRIDAHMTLLDGEGGAVTRTVPLQVSQATSPEGMVGQFRRQFERWLPRLVAELRSEME
jgi:hypothetical protein